MDFSTSLCGLFAFYIWSSVVKSVFAHDYYALCGLFCSASVLLMHPFGLTLTLHNWFCFYYDPSVLYLVVFFYRNVYTQLYFMKSFIGVLIAEFNQLILILIIETFRITCHIVCFIFAKLFFPSFLLFLFVSWLDKVIY